MAHQKPPEAQPSLTFCLSCETANTLIHCAKPNRCRTSSKPLSSINYFTLLERKKIPNIIVQIWSPSKFCKAVWQLLNFIIVQFRFIGKNLPIIIFVSLTLEFHLQLSPGLVLYKCSHSYITKLKHCVASYTLHLPQHAGWSVPVQWAETIL